MSLPALFMLHGANSTGAEMEPLAAPLRAFATVHSPNLPGHGGRELPTRLSVADAAEDLVAALDRAGVQRAFLVGYSMGGYIALHAARHHPDRILGACALATKYFFTAETVKHWVYLAQPERLSRPGNPRGGELQRAHAPTDWKALSLANSRLFEDVLRAPPLPVTELAAITRPVLLINSSRDQLVDWDETKALAKLIPGARLAMFYGIAHPLVNVPHGAVAKVIGDWMAEVAPA